jgi:hypothetical protein
MTEEQMARPKEIYGQAVDETDLDALGLARIFWTEVFDDQPYDRIYGDTDVWGSLDRNSAHRDGRPDNPFETTNKSRNSRSIITTTSSRNASRQARKNANKKKNKNKNPPKSKHPGKTARKRRNREKKRWYFGVDKVSAGPFNLGGFGMGSGSGPRRSMNDMNGMVGLGYRAENPQLTMPYMKTKHGAQGPIQVLCGTELISVVDVASTGNSGDILKRVMVNPSNFANTRLVQFAPLFQRYRFRKLLFHYVPIANATVNGQVIGFCSYDVDNILTTDDPVNVQIAAAQIYQRNNQVWEPQTYPAGILDNYTTLFTNLGTGEARLIYQIIFYLIAASTIQVGQLGNIYIEYECEFSIPQLNPIDVSAEAVLGFNGNINGRTPTTPWGSSISVAPVGGVASNITNSYNNTTGVLTLSQVPQGTYVMATSFGQFTQAATGADGFSTAMSYIGCSALVEYPSEITSSAATSSNLGLYADHWAVLDVIGPTVVFTPSFVPVTSTAITASGTTAPNFCLVSIGPLIPPVLNHTKFVEPIYMQDGKVYKTPSQYPASEYEEAILREDQRKLLERMVSLETKWLENNTSLNYSPGKSSYPDITRVFQPCINLDDSLDVEKDKTNEEIVSSIPTKEKEKFVSLNGMLNALHHEDHYLDSDFDDEGIIISSRDYKQFKKFLKGKGTLKQVD